MPQTYTVTDPTTGKTVKLTGDSPPTEVELEEIFAKLNQSSAPRSAAGSAAAFGGGVLSQINPIEIAKGLYNTVRHPIDTAGALVNAQIDQGRQAVDLAKQGRYTEMVGHGLAATLPIIGPAAANIGEEIAATGDVARGLGKSTGLIGTVLAPAAIRGAAKTVKASGLGTKAANVLQSGAESRIVDVMTPKVGANKIRFGNMAADVAGHVADEPGLGAASRSGLHAKVADKLSDAEAALDAASDARNVGRAYPTAPILKSLRDAKTKLTAEAVKASETPAYVNIADKGKPIHVVSAERPTPPLGDDVVPSPSAVRVAQIDKAIKEVQALGPLARYESIRRIRASWDGPARAKYSPSMTADYLAKQGEASGAADVTGALRGHLAAMDPATAKANQTYALWKKADDVLQAAEETERVRPTVGRKIMARFAGTVAGGELGGGAGAALGLVLGPIIDGVVSSGLTSKIATARLMSDLAKALRTGNTEQAVARIRMLRSIALAAPRAATVPETAPASLGLAAANQESQ